MHTPPQGASGLALRVLRARRAVLSLHPDHPVIEPIEEDVVRAARAHGEATEVELSAAAAPGEEESPASDAAARDMCRKRQRARRLDGAGLPRKTFAVDVFSRPRCGGRRRVLAYLTQGSVIRLVLRHPHLPELPPPQAPARGPAPQALGE